MTRIRYDGVETYLGAELAAGANTIQFNAPLAMDGGVSVPTLSTGDYIVLSILDANYVLSEIVYLTAYTEGDTTGYIDRAQEGTTAKAHALGSKVVHSATAEDFIAVQDHDADPTAHSEALTAIAQGVVTAAITAHVEDPPQDPHTYYVRKDDAQFDGEVVFGGDSNITVNGTLTIAEGGQLIVNGDLRIEGTGRLFINGKQLFISNTEPDQPSSNIVWMQTFGA